MCKYEIFLKTDFNVLCAMKCLLLPHTLVITAYEIKDILKTHTPLPATVNKNIRQNIKKHTIYYFKFILTRIQLFLNKRLDLHNLHAMKY